MEYEIGIIQSFDKVHFRAATWYYDIKNFINDNGITAPGSGAGSDCLYNIDSVELYGFELEAALHINRKIRLNASYIFQEHEVSQSGYEQDWTYYLPATLPKHKVKVLAGYEIMPEGWMELSSRFVGSRGTQQNGNLKDYLVCDLGFSKKLTFKGLEYDLKFYMNNITGENYQEVAGYPMPKHVWGMALGVNF